MKKMILRQKIWLALMVVANAAVWIIPSDVVENIARDHHTLLGRYSRQHFVAGIGLLLFTFVSFYVDWSTGKTYKRRWFQVLATLMVAGPMLLVMDYLARSGTELHYIRESLAYHHPPNFSITAEIPDIPKAARTYPNAPAGFETKTCTLTTDKRGFRNQSDLQQYDIVVLGDSFAEGSKVSDGEAWPAILSANSGESVYNLGMSGYSPLNYLASLVEHGLALKPKVVICGIYEGNDFRSSKSDRKTMQPSISKRLKAYFKVSPLVSGFDEFMVNTLGTINCKGKVQGDDILSWMPIEVPTGPHARHYAFAPKQLRDMYESADEFSIDKHWLNPRSKLAEMKERCGEIGARFVVVYCPSKAHVTLPLAADSIDHTKIHAFMKLRHKKKLPDPDMFVKQLLDRADDRETVVAKWCQREHIEFVSMTEPLRTAAAAGKQVYFTYDQHWTPLGHEVVSQAMSAYLKIDSARQAALSAP